MSGPGLPRISVVIPCFNYERYVALAIDSVLQQSYEPKEILVINDGSTDGSSAVLDRYAGRVRVIEQENRGHVRSCERGLDETSGEIVVFLDADDLLLPGSLQAIATAWEPACTKVQYDVSIIDAAGTDLGRRFCNFDQGFDKERVRRSFSETGTYRWPVTVGNAYSRWFLEQVFPLTVDIAPDGLLNTVAPVYGEVVTIPRVFGCYRIHGANGWSSDGMDNTRLPRRIRHRQKEVAIMREHAALRGVTVPDGDVLDHELPFLNYRLMAFKLGLEYDGKGDDSVAALLRRALSQVGREALPLRMALTHAAWFLAFSATPAALAPHLIRLRFNRSALLAPLRKMFPSVRVTPETHGV